MLENYDKFKAGHLLESYFNRSEKMKDIATRKSITEYKAWMELAWSLIDYQYYLETAWRSTDLFESENLSKHMNELKGRYLELLAKIRNLEDIVSDNTISKKRILIEIDVINNCLKRIKDIAEFESGTLDKQDLDEFQQMINITKDAVQLKNEFDDMLKKKGLNKLLSTENKI